MRQQSVAVAVAHLVLAGDDALAAALSLRRVGAARACLGLRAAHARL